MEPKISAAVVGCGRIGAQTSEYLRGTVPPGILPLSHAEAILANAGIVLKGCCDIDPERLRKVSERYGVQHLYSDFRELIISISPDILSIATRTTGRTEIIKFATDHGVKAMHIEKPISQNMQDCKSAIEALRRNRVKVTYGTTRRFMDIYRKAKEIMETDEIGEVHQIAVDHGRTMLLWNHPHSVDLLLFYSSCSDVEYVQSSCMITCVEEEGLVVNNDPIIEGALIKFRNGISGLITAAGGMNTRIAGSKGSITITADGSSLTVSKSRGEKSPYFLHNRDITVEPDMSGTQRAFNELYQFVVSGLETSITLKEIEIGHNILLAIARSSLMNGKRITLSEVEDEFTVTGRCGDVYA